jgi:putative transposase
MGDTLPLKAQEMPWKECHVMDERLRFVARLVEGEKMAPLCAEFGISRKTGYEIFNRYKECGVSALTDRSRRPYRQANRLPSQLETAIGRLKREYAAWGAPKIREKLRRQSPRGRRPRRRTRERAEAERDEYQLQALVRREKDRSGDNPTSDPQHAEDDGVDCGRGYQERRHTEDEQRHRDERIHSAPIPTCVSSASRGRRRV